MSDAGGGGTCFFVLSKKQKENALNSEIKQRNWFLL